MADESWLFLPVGQGDQDDCDWMTLDPGSAAQAAGEPRAESGSSPSPRHVHLDLVTVMMASANMANASARPADTTPLESSGSVYSRNCADVERIDRVLGTNCKCKSKCKQNMDRTRLVEFCKAWSTLSAEEQGHVLRISYNNVNITDVELEDMPRMVTKWHLCGTHVSVECLVSMLGTTANTFFKKCQGVADRRKFPRLHNVSDSSSRVVDQFFSELYLSCTEDLPETVSVHLTSC